MNEKSKSKVLIDNWTLHNIAFPERPFYDDTQLCDLENLVLAILLWDEVYFWDNGKTTWWMNDSLLPYRAPFLKGIKLGADISFKVDNIGNSDTIARSAQQYQLIASEEGCDYLPHKQRYQYLTSHEYYDTRNMLLQKAIVNTVDKRIQDYYEELGKELGDMQIKFHFPLLLDYIRHCPEYNGDYIETALHIRETGPLYCMRNWIEELHTHIDAGNWMEAKHYIKNVEDIVPLKKSPSMQDVEAAIQIGIPLSLNAIANLKVRKNLLQDIHHRVQLSFLYNIASFAMQRRPEV